MSLVITSNRDSDRASRQEESIYSAYSYRNGLSSTYSIPANSQVALQSAKVNIDGRATLNRNNSMYYTFHGKALSFVGEGLPDGSVVDFDNCLNYPLLQQLNKGGTILELTTDELAHQFKTTHREYHPNFMDTNTKECFTPSVLRNNGLDFKGYSFVFDQQTATFTDKPPITEWEKWYHPNYISGITASLINVDEVRLTRSAGAGVSHPAVSIGLKRPLSLNGGVAEIGIQNVDTAGVPWGFGLSRDCPNPDITDVGDFTPTYFNPYHEDDESESMKLTYENYFEDWGVHRNSDNELVIRQAVPSSDLDCLVYREVKYYNNTNSALKSPDKRYTLDASGGSSKIGEIRFTCTGEQVLIEGKVIGGGYIQIASFKDAQAKDTYLKPINQCCWTLHPVVFIGGTGANHMDLKNFSGIGEIKFRDSPPNGAGLTQYNSRIINRGGWWETANLLGLPEGVQSFPATGARTGQKGAGNMWRGIARCKEVDMRAIMCPQIIDTLYTPNALQNSGYNCSTAMILKTSTDKYPNTWGANMTDILGFPGRSIVITPADANFPKLTFESDSIPTLESLLSVFVRLNNFGQQVMNARTGNKSTILAQLPTADSSIVQGAGQGQRMFYEPNQFVWLDLNNPHEMKVSEFNIDFVYINEQYAKILMGQSVVILYFREKPGSGKSEMITLNSE